MLKKILPVMAFMVLAGCATTPMHGGACCQKAEAKCQCTKCECKDCGSGKCGCHKKAEGVEGKTCAKKAE